MNYTYALVELASLIMLGIASAHLHQYATSRRRRWGELFVGLVWLKLVLAATIYAFLHL